MWKIQKLLCCLLLALSILSGCSLSEKNEDKIIERMERFATKFMEMTERLDKKFEKKWEEQDQKERERRKIENEIRDKEEMERFKKFTEQLNNK